MLQCVARASGGSTFSGITCYVLPAGLRVLSRVRTIAYYKSKYVPHTRVLAFLNRETPVRPFAIT